MKREAGESPKGLSKRERMLGEAIQGESAPKRQSIQAARSVKEIDFTVADAEKRKFTMPKSLGAMIGRVLLSGRKALSDEQFNENIGFEQNPKLTTQKINIATQDGERINAIEFKHNPPAGKTVVVFQGQRGNIMSQSELQRLQHIAIKTGANVVSFNYRALPNSSKALINDAKAVAEYVFSQTNPAARNVTFYGDSLGGAVAAVTAAELREQNNNCDQVKLLTARAPKSLAYAVKNIDLTALPANNVVSSLVTSIAQGVKGIIPRKAFDSLMKMFGGDLNSQSSINKLNPNNVECLRVEGDLIVPQNATVSHDAKSLHVYKVADNKNASQNKDTLNGKDAHNTTLDQLAMTTGSNESHAIDLLSDLVKKPVLSQELTAERESTASFKM